MKPELFSNDLLFSRLRLAGISFGILFAVLFLPGPAGAQTLDIHDAVRTYTSLSNTTVTMTGRAELRLTGPGDPIPGCTIHLNSPDAWLRMSAIAPSQVASTFLSRVRVNGVGAVLNTNVRVVQYAQGAVVIPHRPDFAPLEVFDGRYFTGPSRRLEQYVAYDDGNLGTAGATAESLKLKRGYMATLAEEENGTGASRCYVAQDGDLEVGRLPAALENNVHFVRIFPWRWVSKKGSCDVWPTDLTANWHYNWNISLNSPLDWEYVAIKQQPYWPGLNEDWKSREVNHVLGFNEPNNPVEDAWENLTPQGSVSDAVARYPELLGTGLRVGAPAVTDGGYGWIVDFINQANAAGVRIDYVPVHYYRSQWNNNPTDAANALYNFLKSIYDVARRPIWVTEFNNGANWTDNAHDPSITGNRDVIEAMIRKMDDTPWIERYAIYSNVEWFRDTHYAEGGLTPMGAMYRDHSAPIGYLQEMADPGVGSSARYSFDGDTHDSWDNGQDAMQVGAPVFTAGKYGEAIALNGDSDYLQLSPRLGDSTDWSFAGWVYWNGGGNWQRVFDFGEDTSHHLFLTPKSGDNTLRFTIIDGGSEQRLNTTALPVGVWTHVAVTISGDTGKLFLNGALVNTNTAMTINPGSVGTKFNYLGKSRFPADPLFSGRFDDFRFVSSALTDAQVAAIYNTPPPRFHNTTIYKPDAPAGQPYSGSIAGDAAGTGVLTFNKMDGPAWLSVAANGAISGTPAETDGGVNSFLVRVTDTNGSLHTARLLIAVPALTVSILSGTDDAEQAANGDVSPGSTDLELVNDGATGDQIVGLRFAGVSIPRGAIITSATIQFTADEAQSEPTTLSIAAQAADDAPPFDDAANNLGARPVGLSALWQPGAWAIGESTAAQRTPNLAALVQEVVARPGWASGNAIVFLISGTGHRTADAFDESGGSPPRLSITFTSPTPLHTMTASINSGPNDAEQSAAGAVTLNSTDLELVNDDETSSGNQIVGLRFENVALPAGAVVSSAALQFSADEEQYDATALILRAQAAENAGIFTTAANNLSTRPQTAASVTWSPAAWSNPDERGPLQRTPDLAPLVREIIARPGWTRGNAMAFLISGTGHRTADAADNAGGLPATLTVDYWTELPTGSYERWAASRPGVTSPADDPDGDGYSNFAEYALGLDPFLSNLNAMALVASGSWLNFTYSRPSTVTGVTYQVEWSSTLNAGSWSSAGVTQRLVSDDGTLRTINAVLPAGMDARRFVRLRMAR